MDRLFAFSFFWSVGGSINYMYWEKFDEFTRELFDQEGINVGLPPTNLIFDYLVDIPNNQFVPWNSIVPAFKYTEGIPYFQMVRPRDPPPPRSPPFGLGLDLTRPQQPATSSSGDMNPNLAQIIE